MQLARARALPPADSALGDEPKLLLYALSQQATVGPNNTPQPWGWNVVDKAKWQGWQQLVRMRARARARSPLWRRVRRTNADAGAPRVRRACRWLATRLAPPSTSCDTHAPPGQHG